MKKLFFALTAALSLLFFPAEAGVFDKLMEKTVLYVPNRIMDIMDVFTLNLAAGPVLSAEVHATYGCRCGAGIGYTAGFVKDFNRQYGAALKNGSFAFCGAGYEDMERRGANSLVPDYWEHITGLPLPTEKIYDRKTGVRDYYDFGGTLGPCVAEVEFTLHPVEIADLLLGIFFIDIREDDLTFEMFR